MTTSPYHERRQRLLQQIGPRAVCVIPSTRVAIRNNDVEHDYRQDSDLYYLTGVDEPHTVLVLSTVDPERESALFLRPRNPEREVWDGPRLGVDGAKDLGFQAAFEITELRAKLPSFFANAETVFYRLGRDRRMDQRVLAAVDVARHRHRFGESFPTAFVDPAVHLHESRLVKSPAEQDTMRRAASVTAKAHAAAMQVAKPGAYEYEVEAEILGVFRAAGCERAAYGSIVGSGRNATILHHRRNDRRMQKDELLLIDAGCELDYYACDVTRTFPISGAFTPAQRQIYDLVLAAQEACIELVSPGATLTQIHDRALRVLTAGLIELGLVQGPLEQAIEEERYKPFYMHRTSHWLGMDVHDVGPYYDRGEPRQLAPGYVLTIEPGLYIGENADVDERWRGIGVRIEDDLLVTDDGHENLTAAIPKDADELERILASRPA